MAMAVSSAKVDITPTLATNPFLAGYGVQVEPRRAATDEPYGRLYARCLVLWDDDAPNALVSLDVLALPRSVHQALRPRLVALGPWSSSDVLLQATHTHNGPVLVDALDPGISYALDDLTLVTAYTAWLADRVVDAVATALDAPRVAVTLDHQVRRLAVAVNRAGLPYVETAVPVVTARDAGGRPRAVVFSYGCHPVAAGWQLRYDGDVPAGACALVEQARPDCFALYLQGAAGDQNPRGLTGWALRDEHAQSLSTVVADALATPGRPVGGPVRTAYAEVDLPLDVTPTAANLAQVRAAYLVREQNPEGLPEWYVRHARAMIARIDAMAVETVVRDPIQVWALDGDPPLRLVMVGGELVSGYAVYLRQRYGGDDGLVVGGYANEVGCYVPSNEFLPPFMPGGSYEGGWYADFPGIAGGSQTVYGHLGHFSSSATGVEHTLLAGLDRLITAL